MYKTEKEIYSQYQALKKTYDYLLKRKEDIERFCKENCFDSITFTGAGSSYSLCQSAEVSTKIHLDIPANSLPAGDLMLNFSHYENIIEKTLLVAPSRSGSTTEVVKSFTRAKDEFNTPCISVCARENADLAKIVDLSLEIPWAFDESVCQTRTVTNLYLTNLLLIAIIAGEESLIAEIGKAAKDGESCLSGYKDQLKEIGESDWKKVVVLADSELEGIGSEGALAFKEICRNPSNYHHLLDVRHGPMVLIDDETLVIMATSSEGLSYQKDLIKDIKDKGSQVVTIGSKQENFPGVDLHITIPGYQYYGVRGIPFIFVPQVISYYKALKKGINPDLPEGLDPWIELK